MYATSDTINLQVKKKCTPHATMFTEKEWESNTNVIFFEVLYLTFSNCHSPDS
jgi:hypothetical protein